MDERKRNAQASVKIDPNSINVNAFVQTLLKTETVDCSSYKGLNFDLPFDHWEVNFYPSLGGDIEILNRNLPWYTQQHASRMLGISVKWYRAHLTGERSFTLNNLARWSIFTGYPTYLPLRNTGYYEVLQHTDLNFWDNRTLRLYAEVSILPEYRFQAWLCAVYAFLNKQQSQSYHTEHAIVDLITAIGYDNLKEHYLGSVSQNMVYIREQCGYSVQDIVKAMQVTKDYYLALEQGTTELKASDVLRFAMSTGIAMINWASGTLYKRIRERHNTRLDCIKTVCDDLTEEQYQSILAFTRSFFQCSNQFPTSL